MKIFNTEVDNKWIVLGGLLLVAIIVIVYLSWPAKKPVDTQTILNAGQTVLEKQYLSQIEELKKKSADNASQLKISESKNALLVQKINNLQKEKDNVKVPVTNAEIRARFIAAGFIPLPVK
jgi:uncharacterized protein YpmB